MTVEPYFIDNRLDICCLCSSNNGNVNDSLDVIRIGTNFLRIIVISFPFIVLGLILTMAFGGTGDTISPAILIALTLFELQVTMAIILHSVPTFGIKGVWIAICFAMIIQGILLAYWFKLGKWKI